MTLWGVLAAQGFENHWVNDAHAAEDPPVAFDSPSTQTIQQEIHYRMPEAGEVWLVWGINGWQPVPESLRPTGTVLKDKVMRTPMYRTTDDFVAPVLVPAGTMINYGFAITKTRSGFLVNVWDGSEDFQKRAAGNDRIEISEGRTLDMLIRPKATPVVVNPSSPLLVQEFRYHWDEAGEVWLVWGMNGWQMPPEFLRPPGTVIRDDFMNTPMLHEGDSFTAKLNLPIGSTVDYGFRVEKTSTGRQVKYFDDALAGSKKMTENGVVRANSTASLSPEFGIRVYLLIGGLALLSAALALLLDRFLPWAQPRTIPFCLIALVLAGLCFRLWAAIHADRLLGPTPTLVGDEPGYDYVATALIQGATIDWPCRTPLYPIFLALSYWIFGHSFGPLLIMQAMVGTSIIPLTFLLAHRYAGKKSALLAAGIVAFDPAVISQVGRLYTEVLYTPLLTLTALTLVRALEAPSSWRFAFGGAILGLTNLTRPTAALFPLVVPLLYKGDGNLPSKMRLWALYGIAMAIVISPWSYHNYQIHHRLLPLSVTTAVLWQGSPEYYHLMEKERSYVRIWNEDLNPSRNGGLDVCTINGDRYFTERALSSIQKEPATYLLYVAKKIPYFWLGHPVVDWPSYAMFSADTMRPYFSQSQIIGIFASRLLPIIALVATLTLYGRLAPLIPLLAICAYFTIVHSLTYGEVRHSEPLHPFLATIIVVAISRWALVIRRFLPFQS